MRENKLLMRVTAICTTFMCGATIATTVGARITLNKLEDKINTATYSYRDISESWYHSIEYIGWNTGFGEYEYTIYWYENDELYYKGYSTIFEPDEAVKYVETHPAKFIGSGFRAEIS